MLYSFIYVHVTVVEHTYWITSYISLQWLVVKLIYGSPEYNFNQVKYIVFQEVANTTAVQPCVTYQCLTDWVVILCYGIS